MRVPDNAIKAQIPSAFMGDRGEGGELPLAAEGSKYAEMHMHLLKIT